MTDYLAPSLIFPALDFPAPMPVPEPVADAPQRQDTQARRAFADALRVSRTTTPRPAPGRFMVTDLTDDVCHFPLGDGPFFFCGETTNFAPYCAGCRRIAYR